MNPGPKQANLSYEIMALSGVKLSKGGYSMPDLWRILHSNSGLVIRFTQANSTRRNRPALQMIADAEKQLCAELSTIPAEDWTALCTAAGWTSTGAVALSWCEGAELDQVWAGWRASGFPLKPLPEFERPARFINPALLPESRRISDLITATTPDSLAFCAIVAASPEPLEFDLSVDGMRKAKQPQIAAFLKSRMLQKPDRTAEEQELISAWSEAVKGTEYDIWLEAV